MKKSISLILMLVLIFSAVLAGCSKGNNEAKNSDASPSQSAKASASQSNSQTPVPGAEKVVITMWNRLNKATFDSAIAGFQEKYPNITVKLENLPEGGGDVAQYQAAVNGNELPDIFVRPTEYSVAQLVKLGRLHDLDEVFPKESFGDYTEGTFAEGYGSIDGKVYTFPLFSSLHGALMMYYNKKVLESVGYTAADIPKSWDELLAFGKEFNQKSGGKVYALGFGAKTNYFATYLMNQQASPITPEGQFNFLTGQYNFNTQGYIETMQFYKKAYDEKVLHPATIDADTGKAYTLLKTGEVAFMMGGNWSGEYLSQPDKDGNVAFTTDDWGVVPIPSKSGGPQYQYFEGGSGEYLYVSKETKHWPEVKLFLEYMRDNFYGSVIETGQTMPSKKVELIPDAKPKFAQYTDISKMMVEFKRLTPTVYAHNPAATGVVAQYNNYKPKENVGSIFLGYLQGQLKDLDKPLQKLTDDSNAALKRAIDEAGGTVKAEDFVFPDWVPGENYKG